MLYEILQLIDIKTFGLWCVIIKKFYLYFDTLTFSIENAGPPFNFEATSWWQRPAGPTNAGPLLLTEILCPWGLREPSGKRSCSELLTASLTNLPSKVHRATLIWNFLEKTKREMFAHTSWHPSKTVNKQIYTNQIRKSKKALKIWK